MSELNILSALHHVKNAQYYFGYFADRERMDAKARIRKYIRSLDFIIEDILAHISDPEVREEYRQQVKQADSVAFAAITDKLHYLTEDQRSTVEMLLDEMMHGEKITVEKV